MTLPLPDLSDLAAALRSGGRRLAVGGVVPGARPLPLAALARAGWPPACTLVVVPRAGEAAELADGLRLLAPDLEVGLVPPEAASPYLGSEPPLAARLDLARLLARVADGSVRLLVASARALLAPIPKPAELASRVLTLATGDEVDTRALAGQLAGLGFHRADLVESVGDMAFRGSVIDLHPGGETALRVELDDVVIDRIVAFDPATQRSSGEPLRTVAVVPLEPFAGDDTRRAEMADRLAADYPALAGLLREGAERRLWWAMLGRGGEATGWLEVVDEVIVCDRDEATGDLARWLQVQAREWEVLSRRHVPLPPPEEVLRDVGVVQQALESPTLRIERLEVADGETRWWRLQTHPGESFVRRLPDLVPALRSRRAQDLAQILVVASEREAHRLAGLLTDGEVSPAMGLPAKGAVAIAEGGLRHGFLWDGGLAVYGRRDLTSTPVSRRRRGAVSAFASDLRDLKPGDFVVHTDHGIGRFTGFRRVEVEGRQLEMLVLAYHGGDTLLVPVERADLIQRYTAGDVEAKPRLDRLGSASWRRRKARVKKAVREMAAELLRMAAVREAARGHAFSPDSPWQKEFEEAFEFELTPDQERGVFEIKGDMESERPMDRLLCGDVGYGKTEVALRAAFKAVLDGKQVAVLAPTTILAEQHLNTFRRRMQEFPVELRMLSRFVTAPEAGKVVEGLAAGTVDVVIGTHRLLGSSIRFRDLGLVVIDEEQRFGVAQKERLKRLRTEVDVLSMSATPIPRTLNMALSGLRDISLIETPPRDRQAVETTVLEFSEEIVREAVLYELERGGQVFFVHNRVRSIGAFAEWLRRVVPEARIAVAHGQMAERHLERAMRTFLDGQADVLLATAIIENGLDIPNANTLLVSRSDRFGLAQLYQLRGRVGRSDRLAFAYFLVPTGKSLTPTARARLGAIQEFCELGAGFRIAARDLEIRGAGNLLGAEQHGFLEAVGFEMYCQLLEEAVAELEGRPAAAARGEVELSLGLDLQLPEGYIDEPSLRLSFYKRLAGCEDDTAVAAIADEIRDRFGPLPVQLEVLLEVQRLRVAARAAGFSEVTRRGELWRLRLDPTAGAPPQLGRAVAEWPGATVSEGGEVRLPGRSLPAVVTFLKQCI
ncbi:MAG: transcription-repair coupling factor [Acidobacteria bacterium]|nr:transcription-repair coupling factor [Acidobacteriota bacterium]